MQPNKEISMKVTTREQREALLRIYKRDWEDKPASYTEFRRTAYHSVMGCLMVEWCGMWLGIEPDGYTHS